MRPKVKENSEIIRSRIQSLSSAGWSVRQIATKIGVALNTVQSWKNKDTVRNKMKPRTSVLFSSTTKNMIKKRMCRKMGSSVRKSAAVLNQTPRLVKKTKRIGRETVRKFLKTTERVHTVFRSPPKPLLSEKNIRDRVELAKMVIEEGFLDPGIRGQQKRARILWTDET